MPHNEGAEKITINGHLSAEERKSGGRELREVVPIRHGRMAVSPFTFYRGAAKIMAGDLASTPSSGLTAQLCGDAHLSNFGSYACPDQRTLDVWYAQATVDQIARDFAAFIAAIENGHIETADG